MSTAVISYLNKIGHPELIEGLDWQYNTVGDPTINAWCMPGGKIVFFTLEFLYLQQLMTK